MKTRDQKIDFLTAALIAAAVSLLLVLVCGRNHIWADDFAAYILEARAIGNGTLSQQVKDNVLLHPSVFYSGDLRQMDELVYVWGYPLLLSVVNKLVGSSHSLLDMLFIYKLLNCAAIGIMAGAAYLFYIRRLSRPIAAVLVVLLVNGFIEEVNCIETDLVFTAFCMLVYLLYDIWREKAYSPIVGLVLGACLAYLDCLRLNGIAIVGWFAAMCLFSFFRPSRKQERSVRELLPLVVFAALWLLGRWLMPVPTSNIKDVGQGNPFRILQSYVIWFARWIFRMIPDWNMPLLVLFSAVFVVCGFWGLTRPDFLKKDFWYAFLSVGTVAVASLLPYVQKIRYMMYILPLILLFVGYGWSDLSRRVVDFLKAKENWNSQTARILTASLAVCVLLIGAVTVQTIKTERKRNVTGATDTTEFAFTEECLEVYSYIEENTQPTDLIAFGKPRCMALVTGRLGFMPFVNDRELMDADYILRVKFNCVFDFDIPPENMDSVTLVLENDSFLLYQVIR